MFTAVWARQATVRSLVVGLLLVCASLHMILQRSSKATAGPLDAVIVLGGGQTQDGMPSSIVLPRLDRAAELYREAQELGRKPPLIIVGSRGTPHKPSPHDAGGYEIDEADGSARYLMSLSIPSEVILQENVALDTIGNAWFARTLHTDVLGLRRLAVITSTFHMPRAKVLFDHIFALPARAGGSAPGYEVTYHGTSDASLSEETLLARRDKEARSVPRFAPGSEWAERLRDMRSFHRWLYREHGAYASNRLNDPSWHQPTLDADVLKSYRLRRLLEPKR